jgi:hypothetical protein
MGMLGIVGVKKEVTKEVKKEVKATVGGGRKQQQQLTEGGFKFDVKKIMDRVRSVLEDKMEGVKLAGEDRHVVRAEC